MKFATAFAALCIAAIQVTAIPAKRDGDGPTGSTFRGRHIYSPVADFFFFFSFLLVFRRRSPQLRSHSRAPRKRLLHRRSQEVQPASLHQRRSSQVGPRSLRADRHARYDIFHILPTAFLKCGRIIIIEATHVAFLETALGSQAVKPCEYNLYVPIHSS
jgi:hypothetical protein